MVERWIHEKQCGFHPERGTVDQLQGSRGHVGVCPTSPHVFFESGEGNQLRPSWNPGGVLPDYGVSGLLM